MSRTLGVLFFGLACAGVLTASILALSRTQRIIVRRLPGRLVSERDVIELDGQSEEFRAGNRAAKATFRLRNVGRSPVRIRSVKSSCGCTVPELQADVINPDSFGDVEVHATIPELGEKTASISLSTDSPATPEVTLRLVMRGSRKPPYLARAGGDVAYVGAWSMTDSREIIATTAEPPGPHNPPLVRCDLPFLQFELVDVEEKPSTDPSAVVRFYHYRVTFKSSPPPERFRGEVVVADPWDPDHLESIPVTGEPLRTILPIPPRLVLSLRGPDDIAEVRLRVLVRGMVTELQVEPESGDQSPLRVRPEDGQVPPEDGQVAVTRAFLVGLRPDLTAPAEGIHNLVVKSSSERLTVPVRVRWNEP